MGLREVYELLERLGLTVSFAVVGRLVERYPEEHRLLVEAGHLSFRKRVLYS